MPLEDRVGLGCRSKANYQHVGPGPMRIMLPLGDLSRDPSPYFKIGQIFCIQGHIKELDSSMA